LSFKQRHIQFHQSNQSGFFVLRAVLFVVALLALFEIAASGAEKLFSATSKSTFVEPSTSPFESMNVALRPIGPIPAKPPMTRLMQSAKRLSTMTHVPYVFGGHEIGSHTTCQRCSECIKANHLEANSTLERHDKCSACRSCGLDCSNFVNRVFTEAGMSYQFADTRTLNGVEDGYLQDQYGFMNVGVDVSEARSGDLVLQKGHVILVLEIDRVNGTLDYIHASRGSTVSPLGGIEIVRGMKIEKVQKTAFRILRHRELLVPSDESGIVLSSTDWILHDLKRLIASTY
jgi:NlpC/P60 family